MQRVADCLATTRWPRAARLNSSRCSAVECAPREVDDWIAAREACVRR
jgi:hypothetical protein